MPRKTALQRRRSAAARKGWETRKARQRAEERARRARSLAARKAREARRERERAEERRRKKPAPKPKPKPAAPPRAKRPPKAPAPPRESKRERELRERAERAERQAAEARAALERERGKRRRPKAERLTERDEQILSVFSSLSFEQQQTYRAQLSAAGLRELQSREERAYRERAGAPVLAAAKTPAELRADLEKALSAKGAKRAIAQDANEGIVRQRRVQAWEIQHTAAIRHPRVIVESVEDAIRASKKAEYPKRERRGTRYHATIVAVTLEPPSARYGARPVHGHADLTAIYFSAPSARSRAEAQRNVAAAIENMRAQLPGGAPMFVPIIEIRTSRRVER